MSHPEGLNDQRYAGTDYRSNPRAYVVGGGAAGMLSAEPYATEMAAIWRLIEPDEALASAATLSDVFEGYRERYLALDGVERDAAFVGMDMARKFLLSGWILAARVGLDLAAQAFRDRYNYVMDDPTYTAAVAAWTRAAED